MKTEKTVGDEKEKLTDEQIGKLQRKTNEIIRRINEGTISYGDALTGMQKIIEGKPKRLRLDLIPQKKWWEENGVIYFKVTSDGTTGEAWITRFEKQGFKVDESAKELFTSKDFKATLNIEYNIAVLRSNCINSDNDVKKINSEASKRGLLITNPEALCLIREMFSDHEIKNMNICSILTFHKPFKSLNRPSLLSMSINDEIDLTTIRYNRLNINTYDFSFGFAFEISRTTLA
jgi:hypothetical protein